MARSKNLAVSSEFENVRERALNLDLDARVALTRALLESLEDFSEAQNENLWSAEAERRQQEIREGRIKLVPGDEVKTLLDRVLG